MSVLALSTPVTIAVDVVAWAAISAGTGYFVHRLPPSAVDHDRWVHRERGFERGGALYVRVFRIRRWKHWLPEAGAFFRGGYDKSRLPVRRADAYRRYAAETRRAELGHWLALVAGPAFFLWNPWLAGLLLQVYAIVANGPCIMSQRYNRLRVQRALARMA